MIPEFDEIHVEAVWSAIGPRWSATLLNLRTRANGI